MAENGKKGKKKGLMIVIILVVVLILAAVAVVVLAKMGKINIPGLTPKKPPAAAAKKPEVKPKKAPKKKVEEPVVTEAPLNDKEGAIKLAAVWNEVPTEGLVKITKSMTPTELAPVLAEMDAEKSAALLAAMDAKTATVVSRELKRVASKVEGTQ